jgi:polyisoprenoid-binding protein YceI
MTDSGTTSQAVLAPGTYRIDQDQSEVRYTGKHMFGLGTVHAGFSIEEGRIEVADPIESSSATVVVDAASFHSESARRDKDVRSAGLLDVANHPKITFTTDELRRSGEGWLAIGTLTAHGRTLPVHVLFDLVQHEASGIRMHGRAEHLDRTAFGITGSRGFAGRYLDIDLDVLAVAL